MRQHLGATGLRGGIVGGFNATPTEQHVTATRMEYRLLDTEDDMQMPTPHLANGNDGKHIDYMMVNRGIQFSKRLQEPSLADHDLVAYDLEVKSMEPTYVWRKAGKVPEDSKGDDDIVLDEWTISADAFNEDLSTWINVFEAAAEEMATELMWRLLSGTAERLLNVEEGWSRG